MKPNQLNGVLSENYSKLKKYSAAMLPNLDPDAIHNFRVAYKKLRTFLRMVSLKQKSKSIGIPKVLKKGYHITGQIRDIQLEQLRITKAVGHDSIQPYVDLLQKKKNKLWASLSKTISGKVLSKSKAHTKAFIPRTFSIGNHKNFIRQKWMGIHAIVDKATFSDNEVHTIRKKLKDLFYSEKISKNILGLAPINSWDGKSEHFVANLLDQLGDLEDRCKSIDFSGRRMKRLGKRDRQLLKKLKKERKSEKEKIKLLLIKYIKNEFEVKKIA